MLEIRQLTYSLVYGLIEFYKSNKFMYFQPHEFTVEFIDDMISKSILDFYCVLMYNRKVIGYGMLRGMDEGYKDFILGIAIDKDYQGIDLGKLLLHFLESAAKLQGQSYIKLKVHEDNLAAIRFYKDLGYSPSSYKEYWEMKKEL